MFQIGFSGVGLRIDTEAACPNHGGTARIKDEEALTHGRASISRIAGVVVQPLSSIIDQRRVVILRRRIEGQVLGFKHLRETIGSRQRDVLRNLRGNQGEPGPHRETDIALRHFANQGRGHWAPAGIEIEEAIARIDGRGAGISRCVIQPRGAIGDVCRVVVVRELEHLGFQRSRRKHGVEPVIARGVQLIRCQGESGRESQVDVAHGVYGVNLGHG